MVHTNQETVKNTLQSAATQQSATRGSRPTRSNTKTHARTKTARRKACTDTHGRTYARTHAPNTPPNNAPTHQITININTTHTHTHTHRSTSGCVLDDVQQTADRLWRPVFEVPVSFRKRGIDPPRQRRVTENESSTRGREPEINDSLLSKAKSTQSAESGRTQGCDSSSRKIANVGSHGEVPKCRLVHAPVGNLRWSVDRSQKCYFCPFNELRAATVIEVGTRGTLRSES